jgi:hypothetical protein
MSLYTKEQRVWCKSQNSLGFITEARYVTYGGKRKAEYVIDLVTGTRKLIDGKMQDERRGMDWMCGSDDLRAADYCCDGCSRWLRGTPHEYAPDGEYPNGLAFCFLCTSPVVLSRKNRELAEAYGWTYHP